MAELAVLNKGCSEKYAKVRNICIVSRCLATASFIIGHASYLSTSDIRLNCKEKGG